MSYTPIDKIPAIHAAVHETFRSRLTYPLSWRQNQLYALVRMMKENHETFVKAVFEDLGRPALDTYAGEIGPLIDRALQSAEKLPVWAQTEDKTDEVPEAQKSWNVKVFREPKGVVFVIAPWNYPVILSLQPLLGAIASGCCCVIKPSEVAPAYAAVLQQLLPKYLDTRAFQVIYGAVPETTKALELKWDHIFYTGNGMIGRIVAAAAAKHLTPITLELGGKSPVIVDPEYPDLDLAARRIFWGKASNSGQICVTPDYVLLPNQSMLEPFIKSLMKAYNEFHPGDDGVPSAMTSASYAKMVSPAHFTRVATLLKSTKGRIIAGGKTDQAKLKIEPTIVVFDKGSNWEDDALMTGENFGPILPVIVVPGGNDKETGTQVFERTTDYVRNRDHPLVLYAFTERQEIKDFIRERTMSGSIVFNDTFIQLSVNELPFGGVGESGYGRQILRYSFDAFSYMRSSIDVPRAAEPFLAIRYPPYTEASLNIFKQAWVDVEIPKDKEN
ncbi:aldehyde dehydrogenase [Mycena floridula]|nr:aldehyde dehydrogenase [Mycena floridula]